MRHNTPTRLVPPLGVTFSLEVYVIVIAVVFVFLFLVMTETGSAADPYWNEPE